MGIMPIYNHSPIVFPETPSGQVLSDDGSWITAGGTSVWGAITGTIGDQSDLLSVLGGLQDDIDSKAASAHAHSPTDVTGTAVIDSDERLSDARTPTAHAHAIADTTNLQTTLDGKATSGHTHAGVYEPANANIQTHVTAAHAPSNAQKNSDILKAEIEAVLTGEISSHTHAGGGSSVGVLDDIQISVLQSDGTLNAASGVQTWCGTNKTGQDTFTLAANSTYLVRGVWLVGTGATTHTTAMAWALSGATVTSFQYVVTLWSAAANAVVTAQSTVQVSGVASKVLNATSTAVCTNIQFEGILVTGNAGTITPQIAFSANPTGTNLMKIGSCTSFSRLGANTVTVTGGWA